LYDDDNFYINGEVFILDTSLKALIEPLANQKLIDLTVIKIKFDTHNTFALQTLYDLYQQDYLSLV
jgi:hypothetical protein